MPAARVNVYDVFGAKIARGWRRVKPVSPESQTIRQGARDPAPKAASRSQEEIGRLTENRPLTDDVTTGRSNSTVIGASAGTPTAPRLGVS